MKLQDKVYLIWGDQIDTGVIVATKWGFYKRLPRKLYVVKVVKENGSISDILTTAFYGPSTDLRATTANRLILVPEQNEEAKA